MARLRNYLRFSLSVRAHLVGLVLVVLAPLLLFSGFLVLRSAAHEEEIMAAVVRQRTQAAAATIDYALGALRARLLILAASPQLLSGDIDGFRKAAERVAEELDLTVVLCDPTGQEVINTRAGPGAVLPVTTDPDAIKRVAITRQTYVSDLTRGAVTHELFAAINVPVLLNDQLTYVLSLNVAPALPRILTQVALPPEWIATLSDRQGYTIARTREAQRFLGQKGRESIIERFRDAEEDWFPLVSREGVPVYNAFAHVKISGWVIAVGIPDAVLFAPVRHSTWTLLLVGGGTMTVALLLALLIGHRLTAPMRALVELAREVGRGERVQSRATGLYEADLVAASLRQASEQIDRSASERRELLQRTVVAQEVERKRIARDLHDSIGQYLTALRIGFTAIEPYCASNEPARRGLTELKALASELGRELNRMAWQLRPMALDHLGLRRAVTQYLEEWAERAGLHIDLEITLGDRRLPQAVEETLFRVLQEAIANVVKHSGADHVGVILEASNREARLIVEDNGRGFQLQEGSDTALDSRHLGLIGVRERLALAKGTLDVESARGVGTTIYVTVPL